MKRKKPILAIVLGIRPDLIRAALLMKFLKQAKDIDVRLIWSGQHYSPNMKSIFFKDLNIKKPDYDLGCKGETDAEICSKLIMRLYPLLQQLHPCAVCFLGDTNTTMGCIAAMQLNIPIVHIEGCWRSYDWRMPEEKYRTLIDHVADIIYTYEQEYKEQGIQEGLNPRSIIVTKNPIVDILQEFYFKKRKSFERLSTKTFFTSRGLTQHRYILMTCHRRENVENKEALQNIMKLVEKAKIPVYFPASYRTQNMLRMFRIPLPKNCIVTNPIGYQDMLQLLTKAQAVFTDSGTVIEETCVLGIPAIQMRKSTERPQVYDVQSCVKFDPEQPKKYPFGRVLKKLAYIQQHRTWKQPLGDGCASKRIAQDLIKRVRTNAFRTHSPKALHLSTERSYREDGIPI